MQTSAGISPPAEVLITNPASGDAEKMTNLERARRTSIRQAAIDAGQRTYYTGVACKRGHFSPRQARDKNCLECLNLPEKVASRSAGCKRWRSRQDPVRLREMDARLNRQMRSRNSEGLALYERTRRKELHAINYDETLMKRRIRDMRRRARLAKMPGCFGMDDIRMLFAEQGEKCAGYWCGVSIADYFEIDHNIPVSRDGATNWPSNLVLLCLSCNRKKWARSMSDWFKLLGGYQCPKSSQPLRSSSPRPTARL